jgi:hypothetical protein
MGQVWITAVFLSLSICAMTQEDTPKTKVSDDSLTPEQIAVYRAVLKDTTKGSDGALNLANKTEPLDQSDKACFEGIEAGVSKASAPVVHRLDPSPVLNTRIVLVNPNRQQKTIKENDPQNLVKKAVDDHERVTDAQVDQSVKQAFQSGLFTLSEILFDKEHRRAVVAYSFVCGMLCGNSNTLVLKKVGQYWRVTRRCGGWVS